MQTLYIFIALLTFKTMSINAQTITPIYFINDSIDVSKIKIIDLKNGEILKTNFKNKLLEVTESYSDTVKMIIPFKNGAEIILDSVPTRFIDIACVINVHVNSLAEKHCCLVSYLWGDVMRPRNQGSNCTSQKNEVLIASGESYYDGFTKDLGIKVFDKMATKEYFERMRKRNN